MTRPLRINYPNAFYHVTCRGNEQKAIYRGEEDSSAFLSYLEEALESRRVLLHAYVLMTNHFHLVVEVPQGNLSAFMRNLNVSYTGYFNRRHHRVGHLYQGRFKAIVAEADAYLLELSRYVHLNPIRLKRYERIPVEEKLGMLKAYPRSSLKGYLKLQDRETFMTYDRVLGYLVGDERSRRRAYARFVEEGVRRGAESPLQEAVGQVLLGGESFLDQMKKVVQKARNPEQPSIRVMYRLSPDQVIRNVCRVLRLEEEKICRRGAGWPRVFLMDCLHRYSGLTQREIGEKMGVGYSRVSRARAEFKRQMREQPKIQ
jgi:putative transposase